MDEVTTCSSCERCTWNPGPDCDEPSHPHCAHCSHCRYRHTDQVTASSDPVVLPGTASYALDLEPSEIERLGLVMRDLLNQEWLEWVNVRQGDGAYFEIEGSVKVSADDAELLQRVLDARPQRVIPATEFRERWKLVDAEGAVLASSFTPSFIIETRGFPVKAMCEDGQEIPISPSLMMPGDKINLSRW